MIIDIGHLGLSVSDFDVYKSFFLTLGYNQEFEEKRITNLTIKKRLLSAYNEYHDLLLLSKTGSLKVELLNHYTTNQNTSSVIIPLFDNLEIDHTISTKGNGINKIQINDLFQDAYLFRSPNDFIFNKMVINAYDIDYFISFLEPFGFKYKESVNHYSVLEFFSILQKTNFYIYLYEDRHIGRSYIDDNGFTTIAFYSTSVKNDYSALDKKGLSLTDIQTLKVNNQWLDIFFVMDKENNLFIEIYGIKNTK